MNSIKSEKKLPGYKSLEVLGYDVFAGSLDIIKVNSPKILINTFSPNSYGLATVDKTLEKSLKNADLLVLDGVGIALGSIILNRRNIKKIAGQDCFDYLMDLSNKNSLRVFFLVLPSKLLKRLKVELLSNIRTLMLIVFLLLINQNLMNRITLKCVQPSTSFDLMYYL